MKSFSRLILIVGAGVSVLLLVLSYFFFTGFSSHMMKNATARQADTIAQLTFSSMYQLMSKGWTREQMSAFADHSAASLANTPTQIRFYRAEPVSRQFGEVSAQQPDNELAQALKNGRSRQVEQDNSLTYHMPLVAQDNCLRCHTQAKRGDVLGAISVQTDFGEAMSNNNLYMLLVLLLISPIPFLAALLVAVQLENRFEDFAQGIEQVGDEIRAGKAADFNRVPSTFQEFQNILDAIRKLFS
jgi:hypothetical protein